MDLSKLSKEEKEKLFAELEVEKQAEKQKKEQDRESYKQLKDEAIRDMFLQLKNLSGAMIHIKGIVFSRFGTIRQMKEDLFKTKSDRNSDTYTSEDGTISIKLGNRIYEGWDDTVEIGVQKVREYLKSLAKDENSANLVETVIGLLAKDRKGNLKANKVLELEKLAKKSGDPDFIDGLTIIKEAYRPSPSCQFIEVKYKDENGKEQSLPLSISAFD
jgi:hypothetical protein